MKKTNRKFITLLAFVLIAVLLVPFSACGGDKGADDDKKPPVTVEEYWVERIEVSKGEGFQEEYTDGEPFNTSGLIVKAYWNDGYIEDEVPSSNYYVVPAVITEGVETVTVIYGDASCELTISSAQIVGLTVYRQPTVSTYFVGEVFVPDGMELRYLLDNGDTRAIHDFNLSEVEFSDAPFSAGDKSIEVTYKGYKCSVSVNVMGRGFKMEVNLTSENCVMSGTEGYKEGTNATLKQLASNGDFMQDFSIGSVMTFTFESDTPQANLLFQGSSTYVTLYGDPEWAPIIVEDMQVSRIFDMTVNGVEVPISDQAVLKGKRSADGVTADVANLANWTEVNLGIVNVYTDQVNTVSLTFKDNGYRNANVRDGGALTGKMPAPYIDYLMIGYIEEGQSVTDIEITTPPTKTTYVEGQSFDRTGMVVTAHHRDGGTSPVNNYNVIPGGSLTELGNKTVTVTYAGHSDTIDVTVIAKAVTSIEITTPPSKLLYGVGQLFDPTGMVVTATYNNGTTATIIDYDYSPKGQLKITDTTISVTYGQLPPAQLAIEVTLEDKIESLIVSGAPSETFAVGDDLPVIDPASITVKAIFFSGKEEKLDADKYTLTLPSGKAAIGSAITATLKENDSVSDTLLLKVGKKLNITADNASGNHNYRSKVAWAAGAYEDDFMQSCIDGTVLRFTVTSEAAGQANLVLRGASGWVQEYVGGLPKKMGEMQANAMFDLEVNGEIVSVSDSAIFAGETFATASNNNLANWKDADLGNVILKEGENTVRLIFKDYSYLNANVNKSKATPNLDCLTITTVC